MRSYRARGTPHTAVAVRSAHHAGGDRRPLAENLVSAEDLLKAFASLQLTLKCEGAAGNRRGTGKLPRGDLRERFLVGAQDESRIVGVTVVLIRESRAAMPRRAQPE